MFKRALPFILLMLSSCKKDEPLFKDLPEGPIKHHLIVLAKTKDGIRAKGFSGSTPASSEIYCEAGSSNKKAKSDADGSFLIDLPGGASDIASGEFTFTIGSKTYQQGYKIKDLPTALNNAAGKTFDVDKEVSSISFVGESVLILSSNAALVRAFSVDQHWRIENDPKSAILLNQKNTTSQGARMVLGRGNFALVPLSSTSELALLNLKSSSVTDHARIKDNAGQLYVFNLPAPLTLANPLDADGSGVASTTITRSSARNAEAIYAIDETHYLASFVNYYQYADMNQESVLGPGIVALMSIENDKLITKAIITTPYKNPSFFLKKDEKNVWVTCAGVWKQTGKTTFVSTDAGLVLLKISNDLAALSIEHQIQLDDFSPAKPALVKDKLIVPRSYMNEVAIIDEKSLAITDADKKTPASTKSFQFTFAELWHDDIVFLGDKQGTLVAYSLSEGFFPFPFSEPLALAKALDQKVPLGPLELHFRHRVSEQDITSYKKGYNAWVVSVQDKIIPLDFLAVFGP